MKLILTGAAGFIGSCFLWKLNSMGSNDIIIVDSDSAGSKSPNLSKKKFKDYLTKNELLMRLGKNQLTEYDGVIHLGACSDTTEQDQEFLKKNNFEYSQSLARWAIKNNKIFHYASSAAVYGDGKQGYKDSPENFNSLKPLNFYGDSKLAFDKWVIDKNILDRVVGYRYFNVFGPNEYHKGDMRSIVCKSFQQIKETGEAKLFATTRDGYENGSEQRDFVYIKDINDVMAFFLENPGKGGIFNLGTGKARSFKDVVSAVFSALKKTPKIKYVSMPEKLKQQYQYYTQADISNLRNSGYSKPFTLLEDSVSDYVKSHLSQSNPYL